MVLSSPVPWYGSKKDQSKRIAQLCASIPHERYFEPFLGSGNVFYNKPVLTSFLSDLSPWSVNTHLTIRDHPEELIDGFEKPPDSVMECSMKLPSAEIEPILPVGYRKSDWSECLEKVRSNSFSGDPVEDAIVQIKAYKMSFNAVIYYPTGISRMFALQLARQVASGRMAERIRKASALLREASAHIDIRDAVGVIDDCRSGDLIYADPPYIMGVDGGSRAGDNAYGPYDQGLEWHSLFAERVDSAIGRGVHFVISTGADAFHSERFFGMGMRNLYGNGRFHEGTQRKGLHFLWTTA